MRDEGVDRLADSLSREGITVEDLPDDTGTAEMAARAIGVTPRQIVKSLVLLADERPVIVLAAGDRQVDLGALASPLGASKVRMAPAGVVKVVTGFAIGAVPPVGHASDMPIYMDSRLLAEKRVYAAAGSRHRVFGIEPRRLREMARALVF